MKTDVKKRKIAKFENSETEASGLLTHEQVEQKAEKHLDDYFANLDSETKEIETVVQNELIPENTFEIKTGFETWISGQISQRIAVPDTVSKRAVQVVNVIDKILTELHIAENEVRNLPKPTGKKTHKLNNLRADIAYIIECQGLFFGEMLKIERQKYQNEVDVLIEKVQLETNTERIELRNAAEIKLIIRREELEREIEMQKLEIRLTMETLKSNNALIHTKILDVLKNSIIRDVDNMLEVFEKTQTDHFKTDIIDKLLKEGARFYNKTLYLPMTIPEELKKKIQLYKINIQYTF